MKLEISLFKFDCNTDYLPYYKKHFITINKEKNLLDILNTINKEDKFSYKKEKDFCICLNSLHTTLDLSIEDIKKDFSNELIIEPVSIQRAHSDLLIDESNFNNALKPFNEFIDEELIKLYESFKIYFYASNTFEFEKKYIGDAILLLTSYMIEIRPKEEHKFLNVLKELDFGAQFHTSLKNKVYNISDDIEIKINNIKDKLHLTKDISEQNYKINSKKVLNFGKFEEKITVSHDFNTFNIAYYKGLEKSVQTQIILDSLQAKIITLDSQKNDLAMNTFHINPNLSLFLASKIMLEAYDKSADLLIVDSDEVFYLMDSNRKALEKVCGREILIPILHKNELAQLVAGQHVKAKETLVNHAVNPELI